METKHGAKRFPNGKTKIITRKNLSDIAGRFKGDDHKKVITQLTNAKKQSNV